MVLGFCRCQACNLLDVLDGLLFEGFVLFALLGRDFYLCLKVLADSFRLLVLAAEV